MKLVTNVHTGVTIEVPDEVAQAFERRQLEVLDALVKAALENREDDKRAVAAWKARQE